MKKHPYIEYDKLYNRYKIYAYSPITGERYLYSVKETVEELITLGIDTYGTVKYNGIVYDKTYFRKVKIDKILKDG